ncbi:hypothetical protein [Bacillus litorisediminis]|uniref:hypothetical protein n=1 Tax=Bacillus litorisediminis TaxID=2922713 RepID=UPI001FAB6D41|nr:hypothetical protein [Bacillus litorisediminis]
MKPFQEMDEFNQEFESLQTKFSMTSAERKEIQTKLNKNMNAITVNLPEKKKRIPFMYYTALSLAGLLFVLLAGSSLFQQTEFNSPSNQNPNVTENPREEDNETPEKENGEIKYDVATALSVLKEDLRLGMTQDEVSGLFGTDYEEVSSEIDNEHKWRYDIGTRVGYQYSEDYDFADMDGLLNGNVKMQIWVAWDEESKVKSFSSLYVNPEDEKLYEYRVFPDGTVRDIPYVEVKQPEDNDELNPSQQEENITNDPVKLEEAIGISNELLTGLKETFKQLGEEYQWSSVDFPGYTEPDYSVAKPHLLHFATEEFADGTLQEILMDFYCHCDKFSLPGFDFHIRSELVESSENHFVIKSISIVNLLGHGGYTGYITVENVNGSWKINHWETVSYIDEPINLRPDEYIQYSSNEGSGDKITFIDTVQMPSSDEGVGEIEVHVFHSELSNTYFGIEANSTKAVSVSHIEKYNNQ